MCVFVCVLYIGFRKLSQSIFYWIQSSSFFHFTNDNDNLIQVFFLSPKPVNQTQIKFNLIEYKKLNMMMMMMGPRHQKAKTKILKIIFC